MVATTWNPSDKAAAVTLSGGNLVATGSGAAYASVRATTSRSTGKYYYEQVATTQASPAGPFTGFGTAAFSLASFIGNSNISFGMETFGPFQQASGGGFSISGSVPSGSAGDRYQIAIDFDAGKFWIGRNGTYLSSGNPAAGTNPYGTFTANPTFFPSTTLFNSSNSATLVTSGFTFTPPTGFFPWDATAYSLTASALSYAFTLIAATVGKLYRFTALPLAYSLTLILVTNKVTRRFTALPLAYSFSLVAATVKRATKMTAGPISYALTLVAVTTKLARKIIALPLSYSLTLVALIAEVAIAPASKFKRRLAAFVFSKRRAVAPSLED